MGENKSLIEVEYKALRDEIMKNAEFQYRTTTLALIVAGTFLTLGLRTDSFTVILLVYPVLSTFLAAGWVDSGNTIIKIASYIREEIEPNAQGLGWETYNDNKLGHKSTYGPLILFSTSGLFLGTQLLAILAALIKFKTISGKLLPSGYVELFILALAIFSFASTIIIFIYFYKKKKEKQ